ncbi:probable ATP-dependent RNA helicase DHX58 [Hypomesus transpacificus]|uniref:probable ATP-dependent RNA helicase DHX58 n=1 Tax=Hypomesus transpacificus TaxID=137520 RepID=UPI001F07F6BD|nr:probable ATP-dependent RNA helicase DHX58 [Hypomesus transpacificus]
MADCGLYDYQEEVVQRALLRENIIIWLPTGGGKTRAAVYVVKRHLETTPEAKVAVLVNKVHLVDQHFSKEFKPHLGHDYNVESVSGDSNEKDFFGRVVKDCDLVICTAQILENALINTEDDKHVELTDFTLLVIDECHHTHKEGVYNTIMHRYVEKKLKGERNLPQVLGLTASPGTGKAKTLEGAVKHVLQICANLDSAIVSAETHASELKKKVPKPKKRFDIVDKRPEDPFGDHLKRMMKLIHDFMDLGTASQLREVGTQEYEADVVLLEQRGVFEGNRIVAQCALHLRRYNDALLINDTVRMVDAFCDLESFYNSKSSSAIDGTDFFLLGLFEENQTELKNLSGNALYENPKMAKLQSTLLEQFGAKDKSRGILFCKTRKSTNCLNDWVLNNRALQRSGIKAAVLTGAGNGINYMTQNEQKETIRKFREGTLNLLIATSVAEEGLDIPECNLVVRYGLLTNEIAQQQASGRARASDSVYSVVAQAGGREVRRERTNELLEDLTGRAIRQVQQMGEREFRKKITEFQTEAVLASRLKDQLKVKKQSRYRAAEIQLVCRNCFKAVACGSDIKLIDNTHYVNVNPGFERHYKAGGKVHLDRRFEDWEPGRAISCATCSKDWGMEMRYKEVALLPNLAIKNFAMETPGGRVLGKKWKDIQFTVEDFDFAQYCETKYPDLLSE